MRRTPFILCTLVFSALLSSTSAFAHVGHVGELAGHGHAIAIGATIAAAALAGLIAKGTKNRSHNDPVAEPAPENDELETATKHA